MYPKVEKHLYEQLSCQTGTRSQDKLTSLDEQAQYWSNCDSSNVPGKLFVAATECPKWQLLSKILPSRSEFGDLAIKSGLGNSHVLYTRSHCVGLSSYALRTRIHSKLLWDGGLYVVRIHLVQHGFLFEISLTNMCESMSKGLILENLFFSPRTSMPAITRESMRCSSDV